MKCNTVVSVEKKRNLKNDEDELKLPFQWRFVDAHIPTYI